LSCNHKVRAYSQTGAVRAGLTGQITNKA